MKKVCSCGKIHTKIPKDAQKSDMGTFWNCECKSTLMKPNKLFKAKYKAKKKIKAFMEVFHVSRKVDIHGV